MTADRTGLRPWLAWPLVALAALPVVAVVLVARRVLYGQTSLFGDAPGELPFRERAGLLLNISLPESQLLLPLLALGLLAWLVTGDRRAPVPRAALWAGAAVGAATASVALAQSLLVLYLVVDEAPEQDQGFFFGESLLELYGPRATSGLLLAVLAGGLAVVLVLAARRSEPPEGSLLDEEAADPDPEPEPEPEPVAPAAPAAPPPLVARPEPPADPHARFRKPS